MSFFPVGSWLYVEKNILSTSPYSLILGPAGGSEIKDVRGDVTPVQIYRSDILPKVKDYYDILSVSITKIKNRLTFTMDLAGDANKNKKYETAYIWLLFYNASGINHISNSHNEQVYTLIVPYFAPDSAFSLEGWYMAVFNNTADTYTLPLAKISNMPNNKVQVFIDSSLIGSPPSFDYMTCVMVRVNSTFLSKPPDYLMDSVPQNDRFWQEWFTR
ncbi:MAG TPA: hypothetical protein VE130_12640 [Nitrososphaeraceae archaeon]|jgi:hypothetical protein|nr:hypothetical protein [Nitrososphaeraceae archaeon]